MAAIEARPTRSKSIPTAYKVRLNLGSRILGIEVEAMGLVELVRKGFSFSRFSRFEKASGLPRETIARLVGIPMRTLTRRQSEGRLHTDESDRLLRASILFDLTIDLFEGDLDAARQWLQTPQEALGGEIPLDFASTEIGAREVENLIGRLESGTFT